MVSSLTEEAAIKKEAVFTQLEFSHDLLEDKVRPPSNSKCWKSDQKSLFVFAVVVVTSSKYEDCSSSDGRRLEFTLGKFSYQTNSQLESKISLSDSNFNWGRLNIGRGRSRNT